MLCHGFGVAVKFFCRLDVVAEELHALPEGLTLAGASLLESPVVFLLEVFHCDDVRK